MYVFPNNKKYIGKTRRLLSQRQKKDWSGYKNCRLLWNAIQKYGIKNIETQIIFEGDIDNQTASDMENKYIEYYKTNANKYNNPSYGYNLTSGGEGLNDWIPTPERLAILQEQMKNNGYNNRGKKLSNETKEKIRKSHIGKHREPMSRETKNKISISNSKQNMSYETHIRKSQSKMKKVICNDLQLNQTFVFDSQMEAAKFIGVSFAEMSRLVNHKRISKRYQINKYSPTTTE